MALTHPQLTYPSAHKVDQVDDYHGTAVADPYRWLEQVGSSETKAWIQAQNDLTFGYLAKLPDRDSLRKRLIDLWDVPKASVPFTRKGRIYQFRNSGLQNQDVLMVSDTTLDDMRVLLDPNSLSEDGTVALSGMAISHDGNLLAYATSQSGSDWLRWQVRDIATSHDYDDDVQWSKFAGAAWQPDGSGFYYQRYAQPAEDAAYTQTNQAPQLCFHKLGTPQAEDVVVYERPDKPEWGFGAYITRDGKYLLLYINKGTDPRNLLFYQPLTVDQVARADKFKPIADEFVANYTFVGHDGATFYIQTDEDAPRSKLMAFNTEAGSWQTILAEEDRVLDDVSHVTRNGAEAEFIAHYLEDASSRLERYSLAGQKLADINLPTLGSVTTVNTEPGDSNIYYGFTSYLYPPTSYRYDLQTGESTEVFRPEVRFDTSGYVTRQLFATSKDGTRVPMFVTHKRNLEFDGSNPTLLYGYGGFNISLLPGFSVSRLAWLERGGVLAVASLRGGGEYGETWHQAGTKASKQNVFDDFIACAEHLIAEKITSPAKLAIQGGSNGGLLVGAVMIQRPELFGAALPAVGVMDMLRFHKFTIGWAWVSDYGSADEANDFPALYAYSPLHNLKSGVSYPATLVTTADHDDRVVPAHSFKFAATLQEHHVGDAPVLIRIQTNAGHGAGKPTKFIIEEQADIWAFLLHVLDVA
ncbi:MAG: prolyl oligopeptidase family serine peptidase [Deinococcota bacterium]